MMRFLRATRFIAPTYVIGLLLWPLFLCAQYKPKKFTVDGYVKYMLTTNFSDGLDNIITDNLIHNRLNLRYYPIKSLTLAMDIRTRIHFGELVKTTNTFADFGKLIDTNNDIFDMSVYAQKRSIVLHSMIDRAYVKWTKKNWDITVGRQRINWGVTLIWNPNDIFNTYSFYDFDYEERPGSDAVRVIYYKGFASSLELAGKTATSADEVVAAMLYKWNKAGYDFQVLGGVANEDITLGGGWAGNIKDAGFKGEFSYFHPYKDFADTCGAFSGTVSFDYSFKNSLYINGSFLYVSNGSNSANFNILENLDISAKMLSPYKYNLFSQVMYPFTPILNGGLAVIYSPGKDHGLFINPVLTYSIKENWDIDLVGQLYLSKDQNEYKSIAELLYMRLKWSY